MADRKFAHLHLHTHYSLLDGFNRIPELVQQTKKLGMTACAITDHGNLYGAVEFYTECQKGGINPVIGYEAYLAPGSRREKGGGKQKEAYSHLTLLAKNAAGFRNLIKLSSIAFLEGYYYNPRIDRDVLEAHSEGLICLSGCLAGEFNQYLLKDQPKEAEKLAKWFHRVFKDDFYIEIQNNGIGLQDYCTPAAADIADKLGVPLVATADAHYLCADDAIAHDVLFCINTRRMHDPRKKAYPEERMPNPYYVRSPEDMYRLFPDYPAAVARSQEIADRVDIRLDFKKRHFPVFRAPEGKSADEYLRQLCAEGAYKRYGENPRPEVWARLDHELGIISKMGYSAYFLIVWDFVRYAREQGIPCTARGSGCGAIVAYTLFLSHVCPLEYDLLFERFLDPSRTEPPDIDIDFCQDRRERVIQYVKEKYGHNSVAQIGTFGTLAAKAALKDVGRVLAIPLERVNALCKLVPMKGTISLDLADALEVPDFRREYDNDPTVKHWVDIARKLEGMNRNTGTHAAGVVIANGPITDYVPVQRAVRKGDDQEGGKVDEDGKAVGDVVVTTQWEMGVVEKVGLLKMDFLGLRNLTVLDDAVKLVKRTRGIDIDPLTFPLDDGPTYQLLQQGDAKGVFQLESDGIRELLKQMKPDNIRDLIAVLALYRPGPLQGGMVDSYINRKHGREKWDYPHPVLKEILDETYGVMVYQEQIMRILNRLGGIELSKSYACIKAISKKVQEKIDAARSDFLTGAQERGVSREVAEDIFEKIVFFAGYGFNKCVVSETEVIDAATGNVVTVGELFRTPQPITVHSLGDDGKLRPRPVTDVVWNGRKPVHRLTTERGYGLVATDNHPIWTPDGWSHLGELTPGDFVGLARPLMGAFAERFTDHRGRGLRPGGAAVGSQGREPLDREPEWSPAPEGRQTATLLSVAPPGLEHGFPGSQGRKPLTTDRRPSGAKTAAPDTDVLWDRIASIEYVGIRDTFDLTVDVDHNFVADGLVVHNSHTAAYAQIGYQTAYLKAHYTAEYMAALLSSEIDDGNKRNVMVDHIADARKLGAEVEPPSVNKGSPDFDVVAGKIVFGLTAIKGLGRGAAEEIVRAREAGGRFKDLFDFCERVDLRVVQRAAIEKLIKAGAMDCLGKNKRAAMLLALPRAAQAAEDKAADKRRGQKSFFDLFEAEAEANGTGHPDRHGEGLPDVPEWPELDRLKFEKEALDFYISSHPLAQFDEQLGRFRTHTAAEVLRLDHGSPVTVGGMISELILKTTKQGKRFAILRVEDFTGTTKCVLWSEKFGLYKDDLGEDKILLLEGRAEWREGAGEPDVIVERVMTLDQAKRDLTREVVLRMAYTDDEHEVRKLDGVRSILAKHRGPCPVYLTVRDRAGKAAQFKLASDLWVNPTALPVDAVELLLGPGSVLFKR